MVKSNYEKVNELIEINPTFKEINQQIKWYGCKKIEDKQNCDSFKSQLREIVFDWRKPISELKRNEQKIKENFSKLIPHLKELEGIIEKRIDYDDYSWQSGHVEETDEINDTKFRLENESHESYKTQEEFFKQLKIKF